MLEMCFFNLFLCRIDNQNQTVFCFYIHFSFTQLRIQFIFCFTNVFVKFGNFSVVQFNSTLVADTAPADLRGTAFGVFNFAIGIAMLVASVIAGGLWDVYGPAATFFAGAAFTSVALAGVVFVANRQREKV